MNNEMKIETLCAIEECHLESFFGGLEESQWDNFSAAFYTMDLFLLKGSLGVPRRHVLKHHDTLDTLARKVSDGSLTVDRSGFGNPTTFMESPKASQEQESVSLRPTEGVNEQFQVQVYTV